MKEQLERDIAIIDKVITSVEGLSDITFSSLNADEIVTNFTNGSWLLGKRLKALNTKEQREFKNKDFHVKVWQDSEKIGIETVWIREGFEYVDEAIRIENYDLPKLAIDAWVWFSTYVPNEDRLKKRYTYSYSDIVTELEKADKLSSEVTIYDVIKECEGVTDREELEKIFCKYEFYDDGRDMYPLSAFWMDKPFRFIANGYQLRLKEGE